MQQNKTHKGEAAAADYIMLPIPAVQVLAPQVVVRALDLVLEGMTNTTVHTSAQEHTRVWENTRACKTHEHTRPHEHDHT